MTQRKYIFMDDSFYNIDEFEIGNRFLEKLIEGIAKKLNEMKESGSVSLVQSWYSDKEKLSNTDVVLGEYDVIRYMDLCDDPQYSVEWMNVGYDGFYAVLKYDKSDPFFVLERNVEMRRRTLGLNELFSYYQNAIGVYKEMIDNGELDLMMYMHHKMMRRDLSNLFYMPESDVKRLFEIEGRLTKPNNDEKIELREFYYKIVDYLKGRKVKA